MDGPEKDNRYFLRFFFLFASVLVSTNFLWANRKEPDETPCFDLYFICDFVVCLHYKSKMTDLYGFT